MKLSKEQLLAGARSVALEFSPYEGAPSGDLIIIDPTTCGWKAEWRSEGGNHAYATRGMSDSEVVLRALILAAFDE